MNFDGLPDIAPPSSALLTPRASGEATVERFLADRNGLRCLPFFRAFDDFMEQFFEVQEVSDRSISYVIWGGVAANLLLGITSKAHLYYSLHDIELFLTKNGRIYLPDPLTESLRAALMSDERFGLAMGGLLIARQWEGAMVEEFQRRRVGLKDGDLMLNNVILIRNRIDDLVVFESPNGTIPRLLSGDDRLEMKDASDLRSIDRVARRVYRSISKAIRFQCVAGMCLSMSAEAALRDLFYSYEAMLRHSVDPLAPPSEHRSAILEWTRCEHIPDVAAGMKWLYLESVAETTMRVAGLYSVSSRDRDALAGFLERPLPIGMTLFDHMLIRMLAARQVDPSWMTRNAGRQEVIEHCLRRYAQYEISAASSLRQRYSQPSGEVLHSHCIVFLQT